MMYTKTDTSQQQVLYRQHRNEIHNNQGERTAAHESSQQLHWLTRKSLAHAQILSTIARKA
jgi:hypothetical protein